MGASAFRDLESSGARQQTHGRISSFFVLATEANLLQDPDCGGERMRRVLLLTGIE